LKSAIAAGLGFMLIAAFTCTASAGDMEWGCMGPMGDEQILFSRYTLVIAPATPPLGKLDDLFKITDLPSKLPDAKPYSADDYNSGLQKTMTYTGLDNPKPKLTLTEKSSRDISHTHHIVCGRDEDNSTERKTYHIERTDQPAMDAALVCREYLLTSRGGRPCINR
jgi:hypothetical protein